MESIGSACPAVNPSEYALALSQEAARLARLVSYLSVCVGPEDQPEVQRATAALLQAKTVLSRLHHYLEDAKADPKTTGGA